MPCHKAGGFYKISNTRCFFLYFYFSIPIFAPQFVQILKQTMEKREFLYTLSLPLFTNH